MSNPAQSMATWLANYMDPAHAAIGGVLGMIIGMMLVVAVGAAVSVWMEGRA